MSARVCAGGVAVAVAVAGCGSDGGASGAAAMSKSRYERAFRATMARYKKRLRPLAAKQRSRSRAARIESYEDIRLLALRTDSELARLRPPAEVREAHDLFVRSVREWMTGPAKEMVAAFRRGDYKRGNALLAEPAEQPVGTLSDAQAARDEFRDRGYRLGPVDLLLP
jgi:hypothetical protein